MNLENILEETVDYTNILIEVVIAQSTVVGVGSVFDSIARYYRAMGTYDYLINTDADGFFYGLVQSGLTRKDYLDKCIEQGLLDEPERMASLVAPFFDAIASNHFALARDIVSQSRIEWQEDFEYEDDFAYARFCYVVVDFDDRDQDELNSILQQFESALQGQESVRLELCKSMLEIDQHGFDDAFAALLSSHRSLGDETAEEGPDATRVQELDFESNRRVFVEGLAILRIAERLGLETDEEYECCPAELREAEYVFVPESFPNLELET